MNKKDKSYWSDIENIKIEILNIKNILGKFPSTTDLEQLGYNMLAFAIQKYHGGINKIREIFNEPIIRRRNYWQIDNNIAECAAKYYKDYGELNYRSLKANGHNDFINAIKRRKISLTEVCQMANIQKTFTEKGKFLSKENVVQEVKDIIDIYGTFPPREILISDGRSSILTTARRFGGLASILKSINFKKDTKLSSLEISVKHKINNILNNFEYIDNGRKNLLQYGVNLKNNETGQWFELDRYYYNLRLAVEIHGKQHYIGTTFLKYGEAVTIRTKRNDALKIELLRQQNIKLIIIPYSRCSDEFIRASFVDYL